MDDEKEYPQLVLEDVLDVWRQNVGIRKPAGKFGVEYDIILIKNRRSNYEQLVAKIKEEFGKDKTYFNHGIRENIVRESIPVKTMFNASSHKTWEECARRDLRSAINLVYQQEEITSTKKYHLERPEGEDIEEESKKGGEVPLDQRPIIPDEPNDDTLEEDKEFLESLGIKK